MASHSTLVKKYPLKLEIEVITNPNTTDLTIPKTTSSAKKYSRAPCIKSAGARIPANEPAVIPPIIPVVPAVA